MALRSTNLPNKVQGQTFTSNEFNSVNGAIYFNSKDVENRLQAIQSLNIDSRLTAIENTTIPILTYSTDGLPEWLGDDPLQEPTVYPRLAFDSDRGRLVFFDDFFQQWSTFST